ncbi:hypothetical protein HPB52_007809 [Rhipicephalus sanguineus]|uniref:Uncharacterized protein n=1 Tax=Rhipicephalus sanguineus TaxID=34632 RepID=A0A9D4SRZ8_RHISA|nr:hypothetical protein HPB52_007809 [Rhipicephalus sanguineus]
MDVVAAAALVVRPPVVHIKQSEHLGGSCRAGLKDKLPAPHRCHPIDESGFWDEPPTPCNQYTYFGPYNERSRPLRPSDFADVSVSGGGKGVKGEGQRERVNSDYSQMLPLLSPYGWITVLTAASLICLLALIVVFINGLRPPEVTPTTDDGGIIIDPIKFVAKGESYLPKDDGGVPIDESTASVSPEVTEEPDDGVPTGTAMGFKS